MLIAVDIARGQFYKLYFIHEGEIKVFNLSSSCLHQKSIVWLMIMQHIA